MKCLEQDPVSFTVELHLVAHRWTVLLTSGDGEKPQ